MSRKQLFGTFHSRVHMQRYLGEKRGGKGRKTEEKYISEEGRERQGRKGREERGGRGGKGREGRHTATVVIVFDSSKRDEVGACAVTVRQNGSGLHICLEESREAEKEEKRIERSKINKTIPSCYPINWEHQQSTYHQTRMLLWPSGIFWGSKKGKERQDGERERGGRGKEEKIRSLTSRGAPVSGVFECGDRAVSTCLFVVEGDRRGDVASLA